MIDLKFALIISFLLNPFVSGWFGDEAFDEDEDSKNTEITRTRCKCIEKIPTHYFTTDICGQAALCFWEIYNYKQQKFRAENNATNTTGGGAKGNDTYKEQECDEFLIRKHLCLMGYPKPQYPHADCTNNLEKCKQDLSQLLYNECEPLRKKFGYLKPEQVSSMRTKTEDMNYDFSPTRKKFEPLPSADAPTHNNFYQLSCPVVYRYPYYTIRLLLKNIDKKIKYDETLGLVGVGNLIPKYIRVALNAQRLINLRAMSLNETQIDWCLIPRNFICITVENDFFGDVCSDEKTAPLITKCTPDEYQGGLFEYRPGKVVVFTDSRSGQNGTSKGGKNSTKDGGSGEQPTEKSEKDY